MICRDSSQSLRDALLEFLSSDSFANNLGAAAKATLAVSWDDMLDDVVNRYQDMIEYKTARLSEKRHRIYESRFIGRKRLK
jgi:L-fucose mutarotase/ribose pyranase (RbsD/FucU family)